MGEAKGGPALSRTLVGYAERGWDVFFITGNRAKEEPAALHERIHVIRFDMPWLKRGMQVKKLGFFVKGLWWLYFQVAALAQARRHRPSGGFDLVYGYEICGVPVAKLLSKLWRVPMVARFQGTALGAERTRQRFWKLRAWEHLIGLRLPADLVIMTNDGTQGDRVLARLGVRMERVRFWMNGVDWELLAHAPERAEARRQLGVQAAHVLLTVSRLVRWKRVDRSIRALAHVLTDIPDCLLLIVGDGPERQRLEQLAADVGVTESIRFVGAVPHAEIPTYLAAADVLLSLYDLSNVGNPLLEAMMAGKCVVTLNNGDTCRFVEDGVTGILLDEDTLTTLPGVVSELLVDPELREQLGESAAKHARNCFWTWEERMNEEIAEVTRLIEDRRHVR